MESEKFQSIQDFLLVYSYSVLSLPYDRLEQVRGIEPPSSAWKADILAIVRHLHVGLPSFGRPGKPWDVYPSTPARSSFEECPRRESNPYAVSSEGF